MGRESVNITDKEVSVKIVVGRDSVNINGEEIGVKIAQTLSM